MSQTPADLLAYARLVNGVCPKCKKLKAHDGTQRCDCVAEQEQKP